MNDRLANTLVCLGVLFSLEIHCLADETAEKPGSKAESIRKVKRLLLLGQGPDGHPWSTHEYKAGVNLIAKMLQSVEGLQTIVASADEPWKKGPELIDGADGVVLFVSEGAKWLQQDPHRLAAFEKLAERKGAFICLHWGMGTREARNIGDFVKLFGGCHGGPDRKYKVVEVRTEIAGSKHPVMRGIAPFDVRDEFYYTLKFPRTAPGITPLLKVPIDSGTHTVAWAWNRPDGGRSFGFSGCHFHENWKLVEYRRMMKQGILWSLRLPIPKQGFAVDVTDKYLQLKRPK